MSLLALVVICFRVADASPLPTISYLELQTESQALLNAFATDGILIVPGVPGFADARRAALDAMFSCFSTETHPTHSSFKDRVLADGSQRRTVAAETHGHTLRPLQIGCPAFEQKADVLRTMVHMTLMEIVRIWGLAGNHESKVVLRHEFGTPYMSLLDRSLKRNTLGALPHVHLQNYFKWWWWPGQPGSPHRRWACYWHSHHLCIRALKNPAALWFNAKPWKQ